MAPADAAGKTAGISDVTFQTAEQSLILNTATAYFNVLKAIDKLSYTQAQKDAVYRTLDQTTQRFNVGLVAITDVQNARSNYDTVLAAEVSARNDLDNALETLRQVTGAFYPELASLNTDRFSTQRPEAVNNLLKEAEARNLSLLSARLSQDLAREQIRAAQTGYMPTIDVSASTGISNTKYNGSKTGGANAARYSDSDAGQNKVGISFNLPLYSGGATNSQVKQAQYGFVGASEQLESSPQRGADRAFVVQQRQRLDQQHQRLQTGGDLRAELAGCDGSRLSGRYPYHRRCAGRHHHPV